MKYLPRKKCLHYKIKMRKILKGKFVKYDLQSKMEALKATEN